MEVKFTFAATLGILSMANLSDTWSRQGGISSRFARESVKFLSVIYTRFRFSLRFIK
nr:MAG TPA: hypothetical protein [Caudoviricetes sp.]